MRTPCPPETLGSVVAMLSHSRYIPGVDRLTRQEQLVLCIVLGLLLTGWAVKSYRTAHPPAVAAQSAQ
ncbi:MAG TPA: hypothetical protein PKA41_17035 [Verrucomicrobiota bacterium]|nr:hypothetical protein [Verrucomicrobiota bacterium]